MTYYNTNKESGETLILSQVKASNQDDVILLYFKNHPRELFTPDEIHDKTGLSCPVTSIRRSMSNLSTAGKIVKTDTMREGKYGKNTHCYRLTSLPLQNGVAVDTLFLDDHLPETKKRNMYDFDD